MNAGTLSVTGSLANGPAATDVTVASGATLAGTGTISGSISASGGATVAPGAPTASAGALATGPVAAAAGAKYSATIDGTAPGTGYDRLVATGVVALGGATLVLSGSYVPVVTDTFTLVSATGVTGTFTGLSEGSAINLNGKTMYIHYTASSVVLDFVAPPNVRLDGGGNLIVDVLDGRTDDITIKVVGLTYQISDPNVANVFTTVIAGATGNNTNILTVPIASVTGAGITVNGYDLADRLTLDYSGGTITKNVSFDGGAGSDSLKVTGTAATFARHIYNYTSVGDGNIEFDTNGVGPVDYTVSYTSLSPISNDGAPADIVFNLPATASNATLGDDTASGNSRSRLSSSPAAFAPTDFSNPTNSLTINAGNPADSIAVNALPDFDQTLAIGASGPFDAATVSGAVSLSPGRHLSVNARSGVALTATAAVALDTGGRITVNADADGDGVGTYLQAANSTVFVRLDSAITAADIALGGTITAVFGNIQLLPSTPVASVGVEAPGGFNISDAEVDRVVVSGGGLLIIGGGSHLAGIDVASSGAITRVGAIAFITGGSIDVGTFNVASTNYLSLQADQDLNGTGAITSGGGVLSGFQVFLRAAEGIAAYTSAGIADAVNRTSGDIVINESDSIQIVYSGVATLGGNGSIFLTAGGTIAVNAGITAHGSGNVELTADGGGSIAVAQPIASGSGRIEVRADGGVTLSAGSSDITTVGDIVVDADADDNNAGKFTSASAGSLVSGDDVLVTAFDVSLAGALNAAGVATLHPSGGGVLVDLGAEISGHFSLTDAELDTITAGTLKIGDASTGRLTVSASITRPASTDVELTTGDDLYISGQFNTNGGKLKLDPGTTPKAVYPTASGIDASASTVSFGSDLAIDITGATVDTQYTQLNISGTVDLNGVDLILSGGYTFLVGDVITIVSATSVVNEFTGFANGSTFLFGCQLLRIDYAASAVTLQLAAEVSVAVSPASVNEDGAPTLVYTFTRTGPVTAALTINFSVAGTAVFGTDYGQTGATTFSVASGTATFAIGDITAQVTIDPTSDSIVELDETAILTVTAGSGYSPAGPTPATGTIFNDDTATIGITGMTISENDAAMTFTVSISNPVDTAVTVEFDTLLSGSAMSGIDFTAVSNFVVTFAANSTTAQLVVVTVADDNLVEASETLDAEINALSAGGRSVGITSPAATGSITDDETATVSVAAGTTGATEGAGAGNLVVTLILTGDGVPELAVPVTADLPGNADYTTTPATFGVGDKSADTTNLAVTAVNDRFVEQTTETFTGQVLSVSSTATASASGTQDIAVTDNDSATVTVTGTANVTEGGATGSLTATLTLTTVGSGPVELAVPVGVVVNTVADYSSDTPMFGVGFTHGNTKTLTVTATDDRRVEGSESLTGSANGANGGAAITYAGTPTINVTDNDTAKVAMSADVVVGEAVGTQNFTGTLTISATGLGTIGLDVAVSVTVSASGTAADPADYTLSATSFNFTTGDFTAQAQTITASIVDDRRVEGSETIILTFASGLPALGGQVMAGDSDQQVTITDNDTAVASFAVATSSQAEDTVTDTRAVNLDLVTSGTGPIGLDQTVVVRVALNGGGTTATGGGVDFSFTSPTDLTFGTANGASFSQTVSITFKEDILVEPNEFIQLDASILSDGTGGQASVGSPSSHTATIVEDDTAINLRYDAPLAGDYRIVRNGGNIEIYQSVTLVASGAYGLGYVLTFNGSGGSDRLIVDFSGGNPIPGLGISYNGGNGVDTLTLDKGTFTTATYNYTNATDGNVVLASVGTIFYSGLDPIDARGTTAADIVFNLPAAASNAFLEDDGIGGDTFSRLRSNNGTFETTQFKNPTNSLTMNRGNAADSVTVGALPDVSRAIIIGAVASPFGPVTVTGAVTLAGGYSFTAFSASTIGFTAASSDLSTAGVGTINLNGAAINLANGASLFTGAAGVNLTVDSIDIGATADVTAGASKTVTVLTRTVGRAIDLGGSDSGLALGLTDAELDRITAGLLQIGDNSNGAVTVSANVSPAKTSSVSITTGSTITSTGGAIIVATLVMNSGGAIDVDFDAATLTAGGGGTVTLREANSVTVNSITATANLIRLGTAGTSSYLLAPGNALDDPSTVHVDAGATLDLNGDDETLGALQGAGKVVLGSKTLTAGGAGASTNFSGGISGTGGLIKIGGGFFTMSGANTYTGATSINAGTLNLSGSLTGIGAAVTLAADGVSLTGGGTGVLNGRGVVVNAKNTLVSNLLQIVNSTAGVGISVGSGKSATISKIGTSATNGLRGNHTGIDVNGGTVPIESTYFGYDAAVPSVSDGVSFPSGLRARGGAVVDAGQAGTGLDFTGLGVSKGGSNFANFDTGAAAVTGSAVAPAFRQAILDLNNNSPNSVVGPQGSPHDLLAQSNTFDGAKIAGPDYTVIERQVYHDVDSGTRGFVNYVAPSGAAASLLEPPRFYSVTPTAVANNNWLQRSMIRRVRLNYSDFVFLNLSSSGITLNRLPAPVGLFSKMSPGAVTLSQAGTAFDYKTGAFSYDLGFSKYSVEISGSLADGKYAITFTGGVRTLHPTLGPSALLPTPNPVAFHRLFGDADGDASVSATDFAAFNLAFNSKIGQPGYREYFNFDNDTDVDSADRSQFMIRYYYTPTIIDGPTTNMID